MGYFGGTLRTSNADARRDESPVQQAKTVPVVSIKTPHKHFTLFSMSSHDSIVIVG